MLHGRHLTIWKHSSCLRNATTGAVTLCPKLCGMVGYITVIDWLLGGFENEPHERLELNLFKFWEN